MPFIKLFKKSPKEETTDTLTTHKVDNSTAPPTDTRSLYRRYRDSKRGEISEEDVLKYTGKTKSQINEWAKNEPGVAGNQPAGKIDMGNASGLGGLAAGGGYGGWGPDANSPLKFPPQQPASNTTKKVIDEDEDDN
ncbi:hypothetical protein B0H63DRAFT_489136 [Podospora didyma]|uniref:Uncharacterized protein n=1 Tax=Podospora didyma TaxID=330526 RepID=A0AAE0K255_9PEZI|nr:hypothetical protein B0H63DRAFT_489136 [Podospora didyma]